jgi:hypothetical protein
MPKLIVDTGERLRPLLETATNFLRHLGITTSAPKPVSALTNAFSGTQLDPKERGSRNRYRPNSRAGLKVDAQSDVFSLGIILCEMGA